MRDCNKLIYSLQNDNISLLFEHVLQCDPYISLTIVKSFKRLNEIAMTYLQTSPATNVNTRQTLFTGVGNDDTRGETVISVRQRQNTDVPFHPSS